jgi:DNA-binding CsgD family transcriptional regulator
MEDDGIRDTDLSPLPELVELLVQLERRERGGRAGRALRRGGGRQGRRVGARARPPGRGAGRRRGAERHYAEALTLHADDPDAFERARTELCLGERRRRAGTAPTPRAAARRPRDLRRARRHAVGRAASAELRATGETVRRRDAASLDELTPQELRIALLLAEGQTTRQAAAALYLSPKTIEYHLRHVYLKLGINSGPRWRRRSGPAGGGPARSRTMRLRRSPTRALPTRG